MHFSMLQYDLRLFRFINESLSCRFGDWLFPAFQEAWPALIAGFFLAFYILRRHGAKGCFVIAACALAVGLSDLICAQLLKPFFARPRPSIALEGVRLLVGKKSGYGFPSNHAANMAALAFSLGWFMPRLLPWLSGGALVVAFSRIYVGVHYPLDVAAGLMIGIILGTSTGMLLKSVLDGRRGGGDKSKCQADMKKPAD